MALSTHAPYSSDGVWNREFPISFGRDLGPLVERIDNASHFSSSLRSHNMPAARHDLSNISYRGIAPAWMCRYFAEHRTTYHESLVLMP